VADGGAGDGFDTGLAGRSTNIVAATPSVARPARTTTPLLLKERPFDMKRSGRAAL
jgi:hypothetical protein